MLTENLSTLKINRLTQEQYNTALTNGTINDNELYMIPEEARELPTNLSDLAEDENHRLVTDSEKTAWNNKANSYEVTDLRNLVGDTSVSEQINTAVSTKQNILTAGHNITIEEDTISAVDELPKISISGKNWTQSNITNDDFRSVYYGNDIWVAASYNNGLYYSTDGIIWTKSNIAQTGFQCVYCSNGIWVAGSATGKGLYYSTNGMTWTQSNITDGIFQSIYYGNNIWVAASSLASTANNIGLYYSTDGITWTQSNITNSKFYTVYYGNNIWVAGVGTGGGGLYYSTDGMTWTQSNITSNNFQRVHYDNNIWVAGSNNGLYYSNDGMTWTQSNITSGYFGVYYSNGIWIAYSNNGGSGIYYSTDGITWTQSNITSNIFKSVYYGNNIWVACSFSDEGLYYSADGMVWTQSNITSGNFQYVYYSNSIWVVASYNEGIYYSTSDIGKVLTIDSTGEWVASKPINNFIITATVDESDNCTIDKTYDEIVEAYNMGHTLCVALGSMRLSLVMFQDGQFLFALYMPNMLFELNINNRRVVFIVDDFETPPSASTSDAGKILMVNDSGNAAWTTITNAEGVAY